MRSQQRGSSNRGRSRVKSRSNYNIECYYCHKKGHTKWNCPKIKKKDKFDKKDKTAENSSVVAEEKFFRCRNVLSIATGDLSLEKEWILDLGASYHIVIPLGYHIPVN